MVDTSLCLICFITQVHRWKRNRYTLKNCFQKSPNKKEHSMSSFALNLCFILKIKAQKEYTGIPISLIQAHSHNLPPIQCDWILSKSTRRGSILVNLVNKSFSMFCHAKDDGQDLQPHRDAREKWWDQEFKIPTIDFVKLSIKIYQILLLVSKKCRQVCCSFSMVFLGVMALRILKINSCKNTVWQGILLLLLFLVFYGYQNSLWIFCEILTCYFVCASVTLIWNHLAE